MVLGLLCVGCTAPSAANIALRKQVAEQADEIAKLKRQHAADLADDSAPSTAPASRPMISAALAESLFTTHGIRLGRLTKATAAGLQVHVVPFDNDDEDLKAAGAISVEAFDLSDAGRRVGHWVFDATATRAMWNGNALRHEYVVACPWQNPPTAKELTVKVTFVDTLTGRSFQAQQAVARAE